MKRTQKTQGCFNLQLKNPINMAKQVTFHVFREVIYVKNHPVYKSLLWWSSYELSNILNEFKLDTLRILQQNPDLDVRAAINITISV